MLRACSNKLAMSVSHSRAPVTASASFGGLVVPLSSVLHTTEKRSACRSAFFVLNAVGSRFGCLNPPLHSSYYFCIPILLYGCELWSLTSSESTMLERVRRKILRTIQELPLRCHSNALLFLMVFLVNSTVTAYLTFCTPSPCCFYGSGTM